MYAVLGGVDGLVQILVHMRTKAPSKAPLLRVMCFRHGESHANAGCATDDPALIELTTQGQCQARAIGGLVGERPSIVICSPYLRAKQTAAPMIRRFPGTPYELWPIQEFTYLSPDRCRGTSPAQRRPWVDNFWRTSDPNLVDGPGAESFNEFIARVHNALNRLTSFHSTRDVTVAMFGHGQFFQAMRWLIQQGSKEIDHCAMCSFRQIDLNLPIRNAEGFVATFDGRRWAVTIPA